MLTVLPHGALKNGFDLVDPAGVTLGAFVGSAWRENGQIHIGAERWDFRRERSRRFVLVGPHGTYAAADRTSLWSGEWRISAGDVSYDLVKPSWLSRRYELRAGDEVRGELHPKGVFSSKAEVTLPADLPPPVQVFVIAVVLTLWRRDQASSQASVT